MGRHISAGQRLQDGSRLEEPPGLEGYLDRIKPRTQNREPVYLSTHHGYLFTLSPDSAHPPVPPGIQAPSGQTETWRGSQQVMNAFGVSDVRSIVAVRRAFQPVPEPSHSLTDEAQTPGYRTTTLEVEEATESDGEDEGGPAGLAKAADKPKMSMLRSFELLLKSGHVVRFEVSPVL